MNQVASGFITSQLNIATLGLLAASDGAINWHTLFFFIFALTACGFALAVLVSSHIVRMAFFLIVSLSAASGVMFTSGAHFVGTMQLLIYVGGTVVLLIFGVMLTAQEAFITLKTKAGDWVLGILVGGTLLALLVQVAFLDPTWHSTDYQQRLAAQHEAVTEELRQELLAGRDRSELSPETLQKLADLESEIASGFPENVGRIGLALVGVRADTADESVGLSGYLLPFEIVSVHLVVVLVGAAYLARAKRRRTDLSE
ncbi:MAG: NADH-quinone oxidoreductase subunit J [Pirellulaceae bacterium]